MQTNATKTCSVSIWIAGDAALARQVCREFTFREGLCVWVTEGSYIYTGGEEVGVQVRLINYPRFPVEPEKLWDTAKVLAESLRVKLCQHAYTIESPDRTQWVSHKDENPAAK